MPGDLSCGTCRFADASIVENLNDEGPAPVLVCRRFPPRPVYEADDSHGCAGIASAWTIVSEAEWCGEYQRTDGSQ